MGGMGSVRYYSSNQLTARPSDTSGNELFSSSTDIPRHSAMARGEPGAALESVDSVLSGVGERQVTSPPSDPTCPPHVQTYLEGARLRGSPNPNPNPIPSP